MKRNLIYTSSPSPAEYQQQYYHRGVSPSSTNGSGSWTDVCGDVIMQQPIQLQQNQPHVRYKKLNSHDYAFSDEQFHEPLGEQRVPWRAIALASVLFVFGTALLATGILLLAGYIDVKYADRTWPLIILGTLMFIPGFYHVRLAYYAFRGYHGYSFDDIPDFD